MDTYIVGLELLQKFAYLIGAVFFILGLKMLSSPATARKGNFISAVGMLIAIVATLVDRQIIEFQYIIIGLILGGGIGIWLAFAVKMTQMPQMVGLLNGFGGGASVLVAYSEYEFFITEMMHTPGKLPTDDVLISTGLSWLIGAVTFSGSMIAFAKLHEVMKSAPILYRFQKQSNALLLLVILGLIGLFVSDPTQQWIPAVIVPLSLVLGVTSVIPIGGADMPVVISLLNSYSGMAATATGFVLGNSMLIIAGTLVGASGIILTKIMCDAMNRSLANVLFAGVGAEVIQQAAVEERTVVRYTPEDAAMIFDGASSVIIVPGYGLAVAQAQHVLHELETLLNARGIRTRYAVHPVAGRMPGHMNVLLAEASVPYDLLYEMDNINDDFEDTDIALVVGANDVVNPAARTKKESPLYGMPILNVDKARTVMVLKRSLRPGFAGEDNDLFYDKKTMMVFGDAKATVTKLVQLMKK